MYQLQSLITYTRNNFLHTLYPLLRSLRLRDLYEYTYLTQTYT